MIVLLEVTYPGTKVVETATAYMELMRTDPPPEYVEIIDLYSLTGGAGIRALQFFDVEKGKEDEGLKYVARGAVHMSGAVEGYKADVHVVYNMAEAFEIIDMNPPSA